MMTSGRGSIRIPVFVSVILPIFIVADDVCDYTQ